MMCQPDGCEWVRYWWGRISRLLISVVCHKCERRSHYVSCKSKNPPSTVSRTLKGSCAERQRDTWKQTGLHHSTNVASGVYFHVPLALSEVKIRTSRGKKQANFRNNLTVSRLATKLCDWRTVAQFRMSNRSRNNEQWIRIRTITVPEVGQRRHRQLVRALNSVWWWPKNTQRAISPMINQRQEKFANRYQIVNIFWTGVNANRTRKRTSSVSLHVHAC